jgi:hypothetical protein
MVRRRHRADMDVAQPSGTSKFFAGMFWPSEVFAASRLKRSTSLPAHRGGRVMLDLPPSQDDNRRILAVLTYLDS